MFEDHLRHHSIEGGNCSELKLTLCGCLIAIHTGRIVLSVDGCRRLAARRAELERRRFASLRQILVVFDAEVRLYDVERLLVDLDVLVALQVLDLVETEALFDHDRVRVRSVRSLALRRAQFENVFQSVERHLDDLRVGHAEQFTERWNGALLDHVSASKKTNALWLFG